MTELKKLETTRGTYFPMRLWGRTLPSMTCKCGELHAGHYKTGARNWNPDCPEHGLKSVWYNSPEQQQRRLEQSNRTRELQLKAKEARNRDRI